MGCWIIGNVLGCAAKARNQPNGRSRLPLVNRQLPEFSVPSGVLGCGSRFGEWSEPYSGVAGKQVLDFGCGEATSTVSLVLQQRAGRVIAVDLNQKIWRCLPNAKEQLGLKQLPEEPELYQNEPGT